MKIYNTLSRKKDLIVPQKGKKLNLFVCGPTVYDFAHIGHARFAIFFDALVKYLRHLGYKVFYLQNITDIDDKIIMRSREKGVLAKDLALAFEKEYLKDMKSLNVNAVNKYAKATSYIKEIISQVKRLQEKGFAYKVDGDGIYFNIAKFKNYGKLSGRTASSAEDATSRIDYSVKKINRGDFCLWKFKQEYSEPSWNSPFGQGRPGWHIEDTAITEKFFGPQYDIHGGAIELIFPHHEAEVSQMEAISGKHPLVKYWVHIGLLTINGQKMSKSLKNFITISDFLKRFSVHKIRFLMLKSLWSSPLDFSESGMIEVKSALEKIEEFLRKVKSQNQKTFAEKQTKKIIIILEKAKTKFFAELEDNFNTPKAFAVLFELIKNINPYLDKNEVSEKAAEKILLFFKEINSIFEIINFKNIKNKAIPDAVKKLVLERDLARSEKNWQKSDQLRLEIEKYGFTVEDTKDGTNVKKTF